MQLIRIDSVRNLSGLLQNLAREPLNTEYPDRLLLTILKFQVLIDDEKVFKGA
jgi:hypothetical protein